jgi:hypothetical protein
MRIPSGAISTLIGLCGTGLAVALPDARWIGWAIIGIAAVLFIFQVAFENGAIPRQREMLLLALSQLAHRARVPGIFGQDCRFVSRMSIK